MSDERRFAICLSNADHAASLEVRKVYVVLPDPEAEARDMLRVIDESREDYVYPRARFAEVSLPPEARAAFGGN